ARVSETANSYRPNAFPLTLPDNQTPTHDFQLLRKPFGHIVGTVRDAATHQPLAGITVQLPGTTPTGADGTYSSGPIPLLANQPTPVLVIAGLANYWQPTVRVMAIADQTVTVDFNMIRVCRDVS